jgi:hypothetical protein
MAAHVHVTEPAGLVEMRERSFQQLTASAGITLPVTASDKMANDQARRCSPRR